MTKDDAKKAMGNGSKVTHRYFTPEEWIMESGCLYEFEDGCMCSFIEFWQHRTEDSWNDGWEIYKD